LLAASVFHLSSRLTGLPVCAQSTAVFEGTVLDSQGAAVSGAKVTIKNNATSLERSVETDVTGTFSIQRFRLASIELKPPSPDSKPM